MTDPATRRPSTGRSSPSTTARFRGASVASGGPTAGASPVTPVEPAQRTLAEAPSLEIDFAAPPSSPGRSKASGRRLSLPSLSFCKVTEAEMEEMMTSPLERVPEGAAGRIFTPEQALRLMTRAEPYGIRGKFTTFSSAEDLLRCLVLHCPDIASVREDILGNFTLGQQKQLQRIFDEAPASPRQFLGLVRGRFAREVYAPIAAVPPRSGEARTMELAFRAHGKRLSSIQLRDILTVFGAYPYCLRLLALFWDGKGDVRDILPSIHATQNFRADAERYLSHAPTDAEWTALQGAHGEHVLKLVETRRTDLTAGDVLRGYPESTPVTAQQMRHLLVLVDHPEQTGLFEALAERWDGTGDPEAVADAFSVPVQGHAARDRLQRMLADLAH